MNVDREFLLVKPNPIAGESWPGFLLRLSDENGFPSMHWLAGYAEGAAVGYAKQSITAMFSQPMRQRLITMLDGSMIKTHILHIPYVRPVGRIVHVVWQDVEIPSTHFRIERPQICPLCVTDSGFLRESWDLTWATACSTHCVRFIDACPSCTSPLSWRRSRIAYCDCGYDLRGAPTKPASQRALERSQRAAYVFDVNYSSADLANMTERVEVQRRLLGMFLGRAGKQLDSLQFDLLGNSKLSDMLDFTDRCFEQWPLGLYQTLDSLVAARALKYSHVAGEAFIKSLVTELSETSATNPEVTANWNNALAAYRPAAVSGDLPNFILDAIGNRREFVTISEALEILNVSEGAFVRLLRYGKIAPFVQSKVGSFRKFKLDDVTTLADLLGHLVDGVAATKLLGVKAPSLRRLVDAGHISAWQGPKVDGYGRYIFDARVIAQFLDKFSALALTRRGDIAKPNYVRCMLGRINLGVVGVIDAVLSGQLSVAQFDRSRGIAGLQFGKNDLDEFIKGQSLQTDSHIELGRLAKEMGLYYESLLRLARAGHFIAKKIRLPIGATARAVTFDEAERIKREFIFPREIGLRLGKFPSWAARCLIASGVNPISGPRIDGGQIYIFRRAEVDAMDLQAVMAVKLKRPCRKKDLANSESVLEPRLYLTTGEVAKRLGTSAQGVLRLQRQGFLDGTKRRIRSVVQSTFEIEQVEQYTEKFQKNASLVTVQEAASRLGITGGEFFFGWIRSGRLDRIRSGLDQYVLRSELELAENKMRNSLSIRESAALIGKPVHWVTNRIRKGAISPCSGPGIDGFGTYRLSKKVVSALKLNS